MYGRPASVWRLRKTVTRYTHAIVKLLQPFTAAMLAKNSRVNTVVANAADFRSVPFMRNRVNVLLLCMLLEWKDSNTERWSRFVLLLVSDAFVKSYFFGSQTYSCHRACNSGLSFHTSGLIGTTSPLNLTCRPAALRKNHTSLHCPRTMSKTPPLMFHFVPGVKFGGLVFLSL